MCGRFYLSSYQSSQLNRDAPHLFANLDAEAAAAVSNGDIRPTNRILTVAMGPKMQFARWGYSRDFNGAVINARADKLTGRFWSKSLRERRCIIIATGFYEWVPIEPGSKKKEVKAIQTTLAGPMLMGGIWEPSEEHGPCAAIVTTDAPGTMTGVHDRCPLILDQAGMEKWLSATTTPEEAIAMCTPYAGTMAMWTCWSPSKDKIPTPPKRTDGRKERRSMF